MDWFENRALLGTWLDGSRRSIGVGRFGNGDHVIEAKAVWSSSSCTSHLGVLPPEPLAFDICFLLCVTADGRRVFGQGKGREFFRNSAYSVGL